MTDVFKCLLLFKNIRRHTTFLKDDIGCTISSKLNKFFLYRLFRQSMQHTSLIRRSHVCRMPRKQGGNMHFCKLAQTIFHALCIRSKPLMETPAYFRLVLFF